MKIIIKYFFLVLLIKQNNFLLIKQANLLKHKTIFLFNNWFTLHKKNYISEKEYNYRLKIFKKNLETIEIHNKTISSYKMGQTKFSDLSDNEFMDLFQTQIKNHLSNLDKNPKKSKKKIIKKTKKPEILQKAQKNTSEIPTEKNWVALNKVTPPEDQGHCGSCYAFTSIAAAESLYAITNNTTPKSFSKQNMIDCGKRYGLRGCNGGSSLDSFTYLKNVGAILTKNDPYIGDEKKCIFQEAFFKINGIRSIRPVVKDLLAEINKNPVFITLEITPSLKLYNSGVYETKSPCGFFFNHAALAVGYNLNAAKPYILIKNSWGSMWGEGGYLKWFMGTQLNYSGMCFIANNNNLRPY